MAGFGPIQGNAPLALRFHDPVSGPRAGAPSDQVVRFTRPSANVEVWNRDATTDLYFNFDVETTRGGTDYHLKPGEYWHGSVIANAFHYQGGELELQVWSL